MQWMGKVEMWTDWDFLKVTLGIGPQASSVSLHPVQLLGSCWVRVELWKSDFPMLQPLSCKASQLLVYTPCQVSGQDPSYIYLA